MTIRRTLIARAVLPLILIAGCGQTMPALPTTPATAVATPVTPSVTPEPATATEAPSHTPSPLPPAATATEAPSSTPIPLDGQGGGVIAFTSERAGNLDIYVMNADGSAQYRLTSSPGDDYWPTWSPDASQIAFASERDGNFEIYVMDADGGTQKRLTHNQADDLEPSWSPMSAPGGEQIAFMRHSAGQSTIHVMDVDGGNQRRLTDGNDSLPSWSPDGTEIVFVSERDGNPEIYVMAADGSDQRRLTDNAGEDSYPAWSPDGTQISFFSSRRGSRELYLMDADGDNQRQLTHDDASVWVSSWSPDGTKIAFTSARDRGREIYVIDVDGASLRRMTTNQALDGNPAWRPSGDAPSPTPAPLFSLQNSPQAFGWTETFQVGLGDLDADGDLDAVFANMGDNHSQVWLNDGAGQFMNSGQELTQQGHGLGLGDLDADGDLDIFITCAHYGSGGGWSTMPSRVYLNDGLGRFQDSGQDLGDAGLSGNGVNLVDVDKDGDLDAHVVYYEVGGMADKVYLNDGHALFTDSGLALSEETIAWGDLDADGDVDIFAKAHGEGYRVLANNGSGRFTIALQLTDSEAMYGGLGLGDFDGDGDLDVLNASGFRAEGSYPTRLLWNDGTGHFTDSGQELNKTLAAEFAVGDLDLDGDLDAFVSNMDLPDEVWLNEDGAFVDSGLRLESPSRHWATLPSLGDLDGDGDLDIIVGGFRGTAELWLNGTPTGDRQAAPTHEGLGPPAPGLVAFYSQREGNSEIYLIGAGGGGVRRLTDNSAGDMAPAISPDGHHIAFTSNRHGNNEIYLMNIDGSDQQRLTDSQAYDSHPAWSPDGSQIAFVSERDGNREIYVMGFDGSDPRRLTYEPAEDMRPAWSPDGRQIAFNSRRDGNWEIYLISADGADLRRLTDTPTWEVFPAWSPDGTRIAYRHSRASSWNGDIWLIDVNGSNRQQLTHEPSNDENPTWSPDGRQIAFQSDRYAAPNTMGSDTYNFEILIMDADGSNVQRLTDHPAGDYWPTWGPASDAVVATRSVPPPAGLVVDAPSAPSPVIDGVLEPDEWTGALQDRLSDGSELFLSHDGDYLYVGIRASASGSGVGSICLSRGDQVAILHSSAALGTATYEKRDTEWQQIQEFSWRCRSTGSGTAAQNERNEFLRTEGWLANNGNMGVPKEIEFQIAFPQDSLRLAVTYLGPPSFNSVAAWPASLGDDCRKIELITGPIPERLLLSPDTWAIVSPSEES